jgi:hypothetical protein
MRVMAKIERGTQRVADYEKAGDVTATKSKVRNFCKYKK